MIIIADSGVSKTSWAVLRDGIAPEFFRTPGANPFHSDATGITASFISHWPAEIERNQITYVYFFGAGCTGKKTLSIVRDSLNTVFPFSKIYITSDITGAAVALFGEETGIACIIGTGSNAVFWDGKKPIQFTKPLGYILGDEGSGTRMGISFLKAYLRGEFDNETLEFFAEKIQLTNEEILERIYKGNNTKEFLASFLPLMAMITGNEQIRNIILLSFHEFIHSFILKIPGHQHLPVGFCGSPAVYFSSILDEALAKHNLVAYKTIREPIHELIKYQSLLDKLF